jgi:hypothetical protein
MGRVLESTGFNITGFLTINPLFAKEEWQCFKNP